MIYMIIYQNMYKINNIFFNLIIFYEIFCKIKMKNLNHC